MHEPLGPTLHRITNQTVELRAVDQATARSYVDALVVGPNDGFAYRIAGYYDDELVRDVDGLDNHTSPLHDGPFGANGHRVSTICASDGFHRVGMPSRCEAASDSRRCHRVGVERFNRASDDQLRLWRRRPVSGPAHRVATGPTMIGAGMDDTKARELLGKERSRVEQLLTQMDQAISDDPKS